MDNFKKVSILKSMIEQIDEKNREIKILKSIIKNKEKTIENLKVYDAKKLKEFMPDIIFLFTMA